MSRMVTSQRLPMVATTLVCLALYVAAGIAFPGFFSLRVATNFLNDYAFLGVIAVGLTLVILTGGIDLSVGSLAGLASILSATLIEQRHVHPVLAFGFAIAAGAAIGLGQGWLIARFRLAPFLVTLGGLFLARGVALAISRESVQIEHPWMQSLVETKWTLARGASLSLNAFIFLSVAAMGAFVLRQTRFGRTLYAIGGNPTHVRTMGLAVERSLIQAYALSGLCAALGGVLFATYTSSGNALAGTGLELDAIAAVVIGGTLLSGGYGSVAGTMIGVLTLAIIQTAITFQGTLSSWWAKIAIGTLLLAFVLVQRGIERTSHRTEGSTS